MKNRRKNLHTESYIEAVSFIHNNKYEYTKLNYLGMTKEVTITCPKHGDFQSLACSHLYTNVGCSYCKGYRIVRTDLSGIQPPENCRLIPLTEGKYVIVDEEDYDKVKSISWKYLNGRYAANSKEGLMHRLIMNAPKGKLIDHINRDKLDNRKANLRFCTQQQNSFNSAPRKGTSKYKGVSWDKKYNKWVANLMHNSKTIKIGLFDSELLAAEVYDERAKEIFGEFAYLNFKVS